MLEHGTKQTSTGNRPGVAMWTHGFPTGENLSNDLEKKDSGEVRMEATRPALLCLFD